MNFRILVTDDEINIRRLITYNLEKNGYDCETAEDGSVAIGLLKTGRFQVLILDLNMPVMDGYEVLRYVQANLPEVFVIVATANHELDVAVDCMKNGAHDFITKPIEFTRLNAIIKNASRKAELMNEVTDLRTAVIKSIGKFGLIGESSEIQSVISLSRQVAVTDLSVLITGESGTGKEVLAFSIHQSGKRRQGPWVPVNSAAIPPELADSLLFGHKKGAFTGAQEDRAGYFEQADGGTIFLDEIGDMPLDIQAKVLRTLQEKTVRRVGEKQERPVNFRLISATNVDLKEKIKQKQFREDLFYRLDEFPVSIPPLRNRVPDILPLATHFLDEFCRENNWPVKTISPSAADQLTGWSWPGNIRELRNIVRRSAVYAPGPVITDIQLEANRSGATPSTPAGPVARTGNLEAMETESIRQSIQAHPDNLSEAARQLGISRATLYRKMKRLNL